MISARNVTFFGLALTALGGSSNKKPDQEGGKPGEKNVEPGTTAGAGLPAGTILYYAAADNSTMDSFNAMKKHTRHYQNYWPTMKNENGKEVSYDMTNLNKVLKAETNKPAFEKLNGITFKSEIIRNILAQDEMPQNKETGFVIRENAINYQKTDVAGKGEKIFNYNITKIQATSEEDCVKQCETAKKSGSAYTRFDEFAPADIADGYKNLPFCEVPTAYVQSSVCKYSAQGQCTLYTFEQAHPENERFYCPVGEIKGWFGYQYKGVCTNSNWSYHNGSGCKPIADALNLCFAVEEAAKEEQKADDEPAKKSEEKTGEDNNQKKAE